jgi:hypothetical protein
VEIVSQFMGAKTVGLFLFNKTTHNLELMQIPVKKTAVSV